MKKAILSFIPILLLVNYASLAQDALEYPYTKKVRAIDTFFGTVVHDPYRWLEDPDDPNLAEWLKAQEKLTEQYIKKHLQGTISTDSENPYQYGYEDIRAEKRKDNGSKEAYDIYEEYDYAYFTYSLNFFHNGRNKIILHPNTIQKSPKEKIFIEDWKVSPDTEHLAITLSRMGSDWKEVFLAKMPENKLLKPQLRHIKFSGVYWYKNGLIYSRFDAPEKGNKLLSVNRNRRIMFHRVGTKQAEDELVYKLENDEFGDFNFYQIKDKRYIFMRSLDKMDGKWMHTLSYLDLHDTTQMKFIPFIAIPEAIDVNMYVSAVRGDEFIIRSDLGAPNFKHWKHKKGTLNKGELLIGEADWPLRKVMVLEEHYFMVYYNEGGYKCVLYTLEGDPLRAFDVPAGSFIYGLREDTTANRMFYAISSYVHPNTYFSFNLETGKVRNEYVLDLAYDYKSIKVEYIKYRSFDGVEVPMYILYKEGAKLDGTEPLVMTAYGGHGRAVQPRYDPDVIDFVLDGGIFAQPCVRGGGDLGPNWFKAAHGRNKPVTVKDVNAAAAYLIDKKYTAKNRIAIYGTSHGGLITASAVAQRPDLYTALVADVGVYDMLRYHLFSSGNLHKDEFGHSGDSLDFKALHSYSPLHQVQSGEEFPATLLLTADYDDRTPPLHTFKLLANLQQNTSGSAPIIMYRNRKAGHAGTDSYKEWRQEANLKWDFIRKHLGVKF